MMEAETDLQTELQQVKFTMKKLQEDKVVQREVTWRTQTTVCYQGFKKTKHHLQQHL